MIRTGLPVAAEPAPTSRLDRYFFGAEPAGRLRAARAGLAALLLLRLAFGPFADLAGQPAALFHPVWFLRAFQGMPPLGVLVTAQVIGVTAAALAVLGRRERATFFVAWTSLLFLGGLRASRGKIQHNELLLILTCVPFLLAPVGQALSDRRRSWRFGWPIRTGIAVIAVVYFLTGFQKVVGSGPAWVLGDNLRNVMYITLGSDKPPTHVVALFIAERAWLAHLVAAGTLAFELGSVTIVFWPRIRPWFALASVVMHASIYATHGLDYSAWAVTTVVVLIDWSAIVGRFARGEAAAAPDTG